VPVRCAANCRSAASIPATEHGLRKSTSCSLLAERLQDCIDTQCCHASYEDDGNLAAQLAEAQESENA